MSGLEQAVDNVRPIGVGPRRCQTTEQGLPGIPVAVSGPLAPSFTAGTVIPTHLILLQGSILRSLTA